MKQPTKCNSFVVHDTGVEAIGLRRWLYLALGWFFVGVAALGTMLPILPSTPFLLLASWFFVRTNPALSDWLMQLPVFGSVLHDWERHRAIRSRSKRAAYALVLAAITGSVLVGRQSVPVTVLLCVLGTIGLWAISRLREIPVLETENS